MKFYFGLLIFLCIPWALHGGRQKTISTIDGKKKKIFVKKIEQKKKIWEFFKICLEKKKKSISFENSPSHFFNDDDKKEDYIFSFSSDILHKKNYKEDLKKNPLKENADKLIKDFEKFHLTEDHKIYPHGFQEKFFNDLDNDFMDSNIDSDDNFYKNHNFLDFPVNECKNSWNKLNLKNHTSPHNVEENFNAPILEEMDFEEFSFFPHEKSNIQEKK